MSALGRTSQVRQDGSFTISNVPSNIGRFRVRLIHPDGRTAESDGLAPVNRGRTLVSLLFFRPLTPVPASLALTSQHGEFTAQGQTAQLTVTGNYADSTTGDLTADLLTTYQSSNTFYASVSPTGLVTVNNMPLFTSRVTVSVMHEGVVGSRKLIFARSPHHARSNNRWDSFC